MDRRSLLAGVSCSLLGGAAGCLDRLDAVNGEADDDGSDDSIDLDCERFQGDFGILNVSVPAEVPDDVAVIDLEETDILEYDVVESGMEEAREQRPEAEERLGDHDRGVGPRVASIQLGNGERYEDVEASLSEYESTEPGLGPQWYAIYRGDVYGLTLVSTPLREPLGVRSDGTSRSGESARLEIYAVESVPGHVDVIDAVEEDLDDREYLGEILAIAGCSDEIEGIPKETGRIADYHLPSNRYRGIRDALGESREYDAGWYVEYDGEVYRLELSLSIRDELAAAGYSRRHD